jgi:hypothetical protein
MGFEIILLLKAEENAFLKKSSEGKVTTFHKKLHLFHNRRMNNLDARYNC